MNHDGIPNATGAEWEYFSKGPDHSRIREAYELAPSAWELQFSDQGAYWESIRCGEFNLAWHPTKAYRMRRRINSANYGAGPLYSTDHVNRPPHYTQGDIECIDAMVAAFGKDAVKQWAHINAFKYLWRADHKGEDKDRSKAIWYLRYANGDDPRK